MTRRKSQRATQADVARLAGVSVAVVSYVSSGRSDRSAPASPQVVARVQSAMKELNYRPLWAGRALRRRRTGLIAAVTYSPLNPWAEDLLTQIQEAATRKDLDVAILRYVDPHKVGSLLRLLADGLADGVIVLGFEDMEDQAQQDFAALPVPVLALANEGPEGISCLRQHEGAAIGKAIDHLRSRGVQRIHCARDDNHSIHLVPGSRGTAFLTAMSKHWPQHSQDISEYIVGVEHQRADVEAIVMEASCEPDSAIMCLSDRSALMLLNAARAVDVQVPNQLRIMGMGNTSLGKLSYPGLTTLGVHQPDYSDALDHLLLRAENPDVQADGFSYPWKLIVRDSA